MFSYLGLSNYVILVLLLNLVMGAVLLMSVRWLVGMMTNVSSVKELSDRDNPAYGITFAGVLLGVGIIASAVVSGEPAATLGREIMFLMGYGAGGLVLVLFSRQIFDRISLPKLQIRTELQNRNIAVALTDAANAVATALVVRHVINWVSGSDFTVVAIALFGFLVSQVVLSLVSFYRIKTYNRVHESSLQEALQKGNVALALRFGGFQVGTALGIGSALNMVPYDPAAPLFVLGTWMLVCVAILVVLYGLAWAADRVLLGAVDLREEVDRQQNVAIGVVQAAVLIAIGFAFLAATS